MKKRSDTFYMTQKQQQKFKKKFRAKKKVELGIFFLFAGVLAVTIIIICIVIMCNPEIGTLPDSQKVSLMVPGYLLFLLVMVYGIKLIRRDYFILPFLMSVFSMLLFGYLTAALNFRERTLSMEIALDGPMLAIGMMGMIGFLRYMIPSMIDNHRSKSVMRNDDEDDF